MFEKKMFIGLPSEFKMHINFYLFKNDPYFDFCMNYYLMFCIICLANLPYLHHPQENEIHYNIMKIKNVFDIAEKRF